MGFGVLPRKQVECIVTPLLWSTKNPLRGSTGRSHPGQFLAVVSDITNPFLWEWMGAYGVSPARARGAPAGLVLSFEARGLRKSSRLRRRRGERHRQGR